ncbi:hypothetical protein F5B17DRAFT_443661 [Nemania serpens]|nr:hypothetical protein F5B17DRAFT_443661 [Nemania serpens]
MPRFSFSTTGVEVVSAFADQVQNKTGPSEGGIGAEVAISLAHANPHLLILAGRTEGKIQPVIQKIREINASVRLQFVQLDLSVQASVRHAAEFISATVEKIDIVINNAAIMACPWSKTEDGIESQIINTTSTGGLAGEATFDDVNFQDGKTYIPVAAYAQFKAAMMLFSAALAARFDPRKVAAFSVHPGNIKTNLQVHFQDPAAFNSAVEWVISKAGGFQREEFKTLQQGSSTTLVAALDDTILESSGHYLADAQLISPQPPLLTGSSKAVNELWSLSESLVHQEFNFGGH